MELKLGLRLELVLGVIRIRARLGHSWIGFRLGPMLVTVTISGCSWRLQSMSLLKQLGARMTLYILMPIGLLGAFPLRSTSYSFRCHTT